MKIILKHSLFLLLICFSNTLIGQTKYKVEGIVRSSENKELLVGANVLLINKDLVVPTNNVGYFQIINEEKRFQLEISYIGFKTKKINLTIERDTTISIELESSMLDEVVITENKSITNIIGNIELSRKEIKAIPPLLGEADVLRALALQPGVSGGTEGTVGLNVRGGSPDQNLLLLDDVRVYSQGHLLGFLSIFNSSVIQDVSLQKGVFDVEYGGRLSSIINVTTQSGNLDTTLNEFSLGLVSSSFLLSGHLSPKLSYMAGGRFANTLLYTLPSSIGYNKGSSNQSISYIMYDTNVHLKYKLNNNNSFSIGSYHGRDFLNIKSRIEIEDEENKIKSINKIGNTTLFAKFEHSSNSSSLFSAQLSLSSYLFNDNQSHFDSTESKLLRERSLTSAVKSVAAKVNFQKSLSSKYNILIGGESILHYLNPSLTTQRDFVQNRVINSGGQTYELIENAVYFNNTYDISKHLSIDAGLRYSMYVLEEEWKTYLEPRFSIEYYYKKNHATQFSFSRMTQPLHQLANSSILFPNDLWIPATSIAVPQEANQVSLSHVYSNEKKSFLVKAETFYKRMNNLINYEKGLTYSSIGAENWESFIEVNGQGEAYGLELFISKSTPKWNTSLAYTLSWSNRLFEEINNGNWFPFRYDRRHDIELLGTYNISDKWSLNAVFVLSSGIAVTLPSSIIIGYNGTPIIVNQEVNGKRLPSYNRLDVTLSRLKKKENGKINRLSFGAYNAYAKRNIFSISEYFFNVYDNDETVIGYKYQLDGFSLFTIIPFVNYTIYF